MKLLQAVLLMLLVIPLSNSENSTLQPTLSPSMNKTSNILLVNSFRGSHFFFMLEIGKVLSGGGYNVTLVNLDTETRVSYPSSPLLRVITSLNSSHVFTPESRSRGRLCAKILAEQYPAEEGMTVHVPACQDTVLEMYRNSLQYFHSEEWRQLWKEEKFGVVIAEERSVWAASLGTWGSGIPVVMVNPELSHIQPKLKFKLPILFNSEPGLFDVTFQHDLSVFAKIRSLRRAVSMVPFAMQLNEVFRPFLEDRNLTSIDQVTNTIDLFLINDYPSFSFPFILPRSVVNIGTIGFTSKSDLPPYINDFLKKDTRKTIYLAFGSYVASDLDYLERYGLFIEAAKILGMKIIISLGSEAKTFSQIFLSGGCFQLLNFTFDWKKSELQL